MRWGEFCETAGRWQGAEGIRGREVGRALQAALDRGSASRGVWSGVHMEASHQAWQHGDQGWGHQVQEASDPGHEPFMLPVPEGRMGLIWIRESGARGWKVEGGEQRLRRD